MSGNKKKKLRVMRRKGYVVIYPNGKKPPKTQGNPLKPIDEIAGATLENGELVSEPLKKKVRKDGKNKRKKT